MNRFDKSTHALSVCLIYQIAASILLASLHVSLSNAADTIIIRDLKFSAVSYQLKTVTVHGTVKDLKALLPYPGGKSCIAIYGSYTFTLVDESGEVEVQKTGRCSETKNKPPVKEGDAVIVIGQVQSFHPGDFRAHVPTVRLMAQDVVGKE